MRLTINIHCETTAEAEAILAHLGRISSAELPIHVPPRDDNDEPFHPPIVPAPVTATAPPKGRNALRALPTTGRELLGWVGDQADSRAALRRVQNVGKKLGLPWQVKLWKPDQVARVFGQLGGAT